MQRFGISLFFTNIVFHSSVQDILSPSLDYPNWDVSSNNDSLDEEPDLHGNPVRKQGLLKSRLSILGGSHPVRPITKCCPWGTTFDVNSLTCKDERGSSGAEFLRRHLANAVDSEFKRYAFGIPNCLETVLYSAVADGPDSGLDVEIPSEGYCVDEDEGKLLVVTCGDPQIVCKVRPCIRKCKPFGEFYGEYANGTGEVTFDPVFYDLSTLRPDNSVTVSRFGILFGLDCEGGKIRLDKENSDVNYLGTNGSLYAPGHREFQVFTQNEFCIDYVYNEGIFAFLCPPVEEDRTESVESYIPLALGFIASCVCLFATLVVYLCSRMSKSLYGKTLMSYVGCLCVAYLGLAIVHLGNHYLKKGACVLLGYSILLSFLAAFFWLNVMSVDIWKTFRSLRAAEWRNTPENRSRFTAYSIYAWGSPLAITSICWILDTMPDSLAPFSVNKFKPDIGSSSCWFSRSSYGMYIFFIAPVSLTITCNVILYVDTAWRCWRIRSEINKLGVHSGKSRGKYSMHRDQHCLPPLSMTLEEHVRWIHHPGILVPDVEIFFLDRFYGLSAVVPQNLFYKLAADKLLLNGKLFIVMGVSWGPEFISTILPHPLWKITDAMNTLLGVFIFVIFVLKKKMINHVSQRVRDSLRGLSKKSKGNDFRMDPLKPEKTCSSRISKTVNTCTTSV